MAELELTSTTAPGKVFESREALAAHYQTPWHKYNLKRRSAQLPALPYADFEARWSAAQAVRNEKKEAGTDHLKNKDQKRKISKKRNGDDKDKDVDEVAGSPSGAVVRSQVPAYDRMKESQTESNNGPILGSTHKEMMVEGEQLSTTEAVVDDDKETAAGEEQDDEEQVEIDPCQSLFDRHVADSAIENAEYLYLTYGFFIPDREFLIDVEGLLGYCQEKIQIGRTCLYCQRQFGSASACINHMRSSTHTKLCYEADVDMHEFDVFYDFSKVNREFMEQQKVRHQSDSVVDEENDEDDDWEDVVEGEDGESEEGNSQWYDDYQSDMNIMGFDVTPLGEIIFPDGRIIGHRGLRKYYRQNLRTTGPKSTAVAAAQLAAGERLFRGRVYNTSIVSTDKPGSIQHCGLSAGRGILVSSGDGNFTQLSVYRYRAAVRKQRQGDRKGQKIYEKTNQNMNKMDKKHNRLMNGVSVAHAAR